MNGIKFVAYLAGALVILGGLLLATAPPKGPSGAGAAEFAGLALPAVGTGESASLAECPTPKCLAAYVAPWCGVCRASTPLIKKLQSWLPKRGVTMRVVVGLDRPDAIYEYAREFGPGALVDLNEEVPLRGGVPQWIVTAPGGEVLLRQPGLPRIFSPPITEEALAEVAGFLEL